MKLEVFFNGEPTVVTLTASQIDKVKKYNLPIMERIKTVQDALDYNGKTKQRFDWETERDTDQQKADKELEELCTALKEGKELEMGAKWFHPWMEKPVAGSGSGFSCDGYGYDYGYSYVGARHSVDTADKAIYLGKQFPDVMTRVLSPRKPSETTNQPDNY